MNAQRAFYFAVALVLVVGQVIIPVSVSAQDSTGTISGTVFEADGETPIENVFVWFDGGDPYRDGDCTDVDGGFAITNIPFDVEGVLMAPKGYGQGNYLCNGEESHYVAEYWQETPGGNSATRVRLSASTPMRDDIVFTLEHGGSISGTVYDAADGLPFPGVTMWVNWWGEYGDGSIVGHACSDEDGNFMFENMPFGVSLIVQVMGHLPWTCGGSAEYVNAVWGESLSNPTYVWLDAASPSYNNIAFRLERTGYISGVVTDNAAPSPNPIPDVQVCANRSETGWDGNCAQSDADGTYRIGLPVGEYRVDAQADGWRREFYDNVYDGSAATPVSVEAEQETQDINFTLVPDLPYYIEANPGSHWIHARGWPLDTEITMTIHVPGTEPGDDYTDTATMGQAPWNPDDPNDIVADFGWSDSFELRPGDVITMTGGDVSKTLVISQLQVMALDQEDETVSGAATPGSQVQVCANMPGRCISRYVTAASGPSGDWVASYSVAGVPPDDADTFDLQPGSNGWAMERDEDGDQTWVDWRVPNPAIKVWVGSNNIDGYEWTPVTPITVTVDDPDTAEEPDYTATQSSDTWGNLQFNVWQSTFSLQSGQVVTMTDGTTAKTHTILPLTVASADTETDTVTGTAEAGTEVQVCLRISGCIWRFVTADGSGVWLADYSARGPRPEEQELYDIRPGESLDVAQYDGDGDGTGYDYWIPNPRFTVFPEWEYIEGWDWPLGESVHLAIDDPGTAKTPDFEQDATAVVTPWDPNTVWVQFNFAGVYEMAAGDVVTLASEATTKTHVVTGLAVDSVDPNADTVSGSAAPGSQVHIWPHVSGAPDRWVTADGGVWLADFWDAFDLVAGTAGRSEQTDEDGDATAVDWRVPIHWVEGWLNDDTIKVFEAAPNGSVTLEIYQGEGGELVFGPYEMSTDGSGYAELRAPDYEHDLVPGDLIVVTDPVRQATRSLVLQPLTVDSIDPSSDRVSGTAAPHTSVRVEVADGGVAWTIVDAGETGAWLADFAEQDFDVTNDMWAKGQIFDDDGDATAVYRVPRPPSLAWAWLTPNPVAIEQPFSLQAVIEGFEGTVLRAQYRLEVAGGEPWNEMEPDADGWPSSQAGFSATLIAPSVGVYAIYVRAQDSAGYWSQSTLAGYLAVYDPQGGWVTGGGQFVPGGGTSYNDDFLPEIDGVSRAVISFSLRYRRESSTAPTGIFTFRYPHGGFTLRSRQINWLIVTNSVWGMFQGQATIDGMEGLFPFRVDARDGDRQGRLQSDRFIIRVWAPGANLDRDEPIYRASGDVQGQVVIHDDRNPVLILGSLFEFASGLELGFAEDNGVTLAVEQANQAGGILGSNVILYRRDAGDGSDLEVPRQAAIDLIENRGAQAILGTGWSVNALAILEDVIVPSQVLLVSPSNTAPELTGIDDRGWYYRVSDSESVRGAAAGFRACEGEGRTAVVILEGDWAWVYGSVEAFERAFGSCGGTVLRTVVFNGDPAQAISEALAPGSGGETPDTVFLAFFGLFSDSTSMRDFFHGAICTVAADGQRASDRYWIHNQELESWYRPELLTGNPCGVDQGSVMADFAGHESVGPAFDYDFGSQAFWSDFVNQSGQPPSIFANLAYDTAALVMLAAEEAGSVDPVEIRDHLISVSTGGEPVAVLCNALIMVRNGVDIDWQGTFERSVGDISYQIDHDFEASGETISPYFISQIQENGTLRIVDWLMDEDVSGAYQP